ncbi:MAG: hypothetical protein ACYTBX_19265 [Planctomycetota bacterium]|jgi:hypothetical protein
MFKFKLPAEEEVKVSAIRPTKSLDKLTQIVQGQSATDIEERMYIAFLHNGIAEGDIEFQPSYLAGRNMPGEVRPDFATYSSVRIMVWFADADYWHRSANQKHKDETNDARLFQMMNGDIEYPIRISGDDLDTQELADAAVGEYL